MTDSDPPTKRDTDPSELGRLSLPPNSFTYADVIATHHAILDEMRGMRLDMRDLHDKIDALAHLVQTGIDGTLSIIPRVTKLEHQAEHGFTVCKYHHSNGSEIPDDIPST